MTCNEIQSQLSEYVDGELRPETRHEIAEHLQSCLVCRREFKALKAVIAAAGELPESTDPGRDLWPAIESRLAAVRPARDVSSTDPDTARPWWTQLAAAVIAMLALSVPLSVWWVGRAVDQQSADGQVMATTELADEENIRARAEMARSEDGVMLARTDLLAAIEFQRGVVAEDTLQVFEQNMYLLDRAIGELWAALEEDPYNHRLRLQLAARYQQEKKLLQRVSRV